LAIAPHAERPSAGFDVSWAAFPSVCDGFTIIKFRIVLKEGGVPSSITDGVYFDAPATVTSRDAFVDRAERAYTPRIFACDNDTCTDIFGDGVGESFSNTSASAATTEAEEWVVVGVDQASSTYYAHPGYGAVSSFFYPEGWGRDDKLAFYWDDSSSGAIKMKYASSAGWQNFNTSTWVTPPTSVARSETANIDFDSINHAVAFPVLFGTDPYVRMLAQNHPGFETGWEHRHIVSVDSVDDEGDDFSLYINNCNSGGIGNCDWTNEGEIAICADGTSACAEVDQAGHMRWMWDYVTYGPPNLDEDEPMLVFGGEGEDEEEAGEDCLSALGGEEFQNDILLATWDGLGWVVAQDGSGCPEVLIADYHDPGVTPLSGDAFKIYAKAWGDSGDITTFYYSNGAIEVDSLGNPKTATPQFFFADSYAIDVDCIANVDSFVRPSGDPDVRPDEGMFFDGGIENQSFDSAYCDEGFQTGAMYFAELSN
jgi:hypothetical protein